MTLPSPASVLLSGNVASILADPVRDRIYISHGTWGSILVWNTSSDSLQANVSVGMGPGRMGFSWTGNELFVGLGPDRSLAVVDLSTLSLLKTIPLQVSPVDVAGGRPGRAYVTTTEGCGCPQIVDTEKGAVIGAIRAAGAIYYGGFARTTLDRSILFVATPWLDPSTIYAFDVRTDNVTLRGQSPFDSVGENLNDFRVAPTEPWLFVTSGWPYYVQVIDYRTWTSVRQLATGPYPSNVDLAQRGRVAFAAHGFNDVMGFNTTDGTSLGTVSFSQDVKAVAVSHDGTRVFVITTDIYGGSRQLEEASTGLTPPPPGPPVAFGFADREFAYVPAEFTFAAGRHSARLLTGSAGTSMMGQRMRPGPHRTCTRQSGRTRLD